MKISRSYLSSEAWVPGTGVSFLRHRIAQSNGIMTPIFNRARGHVLGAGFLVQKRHKK
jgi:hypothetical protein